MSVVVVAAFGGGIVQPPLGVGPRLAQLIELLDPGQDIHRDSAAHDLQGHQRRQDGHPGELVVVEPAVQPLSTSVGLHFLEFLIGVETGVVGATSPDAAIDLGGLWRLVAGLVDLLVRVGEIFGPFPAAAVQLSREKIFITFFSWTVRV